MYKSRQENSKKHHRIQIKNKMPSTVKATTKPNITCPVAENNKQIYIT